MDPTPKLYPLGGHYIGAANKRAVWTGEYRQPKRGEWYLSGAIPAAYQAPNDLTTPFHILRLVNIRTIPAREEII